MRFARILVAFLALALAGEALSFTLSDHAVKAFVRPGKKVFEIEAEACAAVPAAAQIDDALAANQRAVRLQVGTPQLTFTAHLDRSTYTLWCIARSSEQPSTYRQPMYVQLRLSSAAGDRQWRMRINYQHHSYQDVAHLYFDIDQSGDYQLTFELGDDSQFDLLVDRLELRDVLAGTWKRGFKTESTVFTEPGYSALASQSPYPAADARQRAVDLAASLPPRNVIVAAGGMDKEGFYREFRLSDAKLAEPSAARWLWQIDSDLDHPWRLTGPALPVHDELDELMAPAPAATDGLLRVPDADVVKSFGQAPADQPDINWGTAKLGEPGVYAAEQYQRFEKLPGRWPDDGGGYFLPKAAGGDEHHQYFNILAGAFKQRYVAYRDRLVESAEKFYRTGNAKLGFRAALMLVFYADAFPSLDNTVQGTMNTIWGNYPFNDFSGNHAGEFGKLDYSGWAGGNNLPVVLAYDKLFPMIAGNQALADAVGAVIPWVKTPADVIELIDVKLLQHFFDVAERGEVRFAPGQLCDPLIAVVQGNNEAGRRMFNRIVNESSAQHQSLVDGLVCRHSRDSTSFIGSMFYAKGPSMAAGTALAEALSSGAHFGLATEHLPLSIMSQSARWLYEPYCAGVHLPGVGDVSGPQGYPCMVVGETDGARRLLRAAWQQFRDPEFAWLLANVYGEENPEAELIAAAAQLTGDPRKTQRSRVLGGFGVAILEANRDESDFRRRAGLVLRAGHGAGHAHNDQLNMELFAHGIPMLPEFGGRGGYGEPGTGEPCSHCLVAVDNAVAGQGRVTWLADMPGVQAVEAAGGEIRRCAALVEAGDGNTYIVDFSRAAGGGQRTYWFHGQQPETVDEAAAMAQGTTLRTPEVEADLLDLGDDILSDAKPVAWSWNESLFSDNAVEQRLPATYQAVWPVARRMEEAVFNRVQQLHRFATGQAPKVFYDAKSPRKFTRLLLLDAAGRTLRRVVAHSRQVGYRLTCVGISEKREPAAVSRFSAVIETFAGSSFIQEVSLLPVTPRDDQCSAVQVTLSDGRVDLFFQSDAPETVYQVGGAHPFSVAGSFAYLRFAQGQQIASGLVGGRRLLAAGLELRLATAAHAAKMAEVDHRQRCIVLDRELPIETTALAESCWRLGRDAEPFVISRAEVQNGRTLLYFRKSAETYRAPLFLIQGEDQVVGPIEPEHQHHFGWLTNEAHDRGWHVDRVQIGAYRWMGTSFRGGASLGGALDWDRVPDTDGDGKHTLFLGPNDAWTEQMQVEVLQIDPALRAFYFKPLNSPAGYAGTRSYAGGPIVNEAGEKLSTAVMPGKMGSFVVAPGETVTEDDFSDATGDGYRKFHVYYFGPGDPATLTTYAGVQHTGGSSHWRSNCRFEFGPEPDLE